MDEYSFESVTIKAGTAGETFSPAWQGTRESQGLVRFAVADTYDKMYDIITGPL